MPTPRKHTKIDPIAWAALVMLVALRPAAAQDGLSDPLPGPGPVLQFEMAQAPVRLPPADYIGPPATASTLFSASSLPPPLTESTWYTRIDYFHWNERLDGEDFVNEDGALITLGYQRRIACERFRAELFGGDINYDGAGQFDDGSTSPLSANTTYLGMRGEYDLLFEPENWPGLSLYAGIGTRLWVRDLKDGVAESGDLVFGYQETWWTVYPYLGLETKRILKNGAELYGGGRIGLTAITYEQVSAFDVALYPRPGLMGQLEAGVRGRRLFLAAVFEGMAWGESPVVRDWLQPQSSMLSVGLKTGFWF